MRIPSLDGVRALAIGLVLAAHLTGTRHSPDLTWMRTFGDVGNLGVRIFFVLSGFLTTTLLAREFERTGRISPLGFLRRRAFRIIPAFAVYVGTIAVSAASGAVAVDAGDLFSALTFTTNFDAHRSWYVGHLWSLSVELQFYVCWPVLLALVGWSRVFWVTGAALAVAPVARVMIHVFVPEWRWSIGESCLTVVDALATGSLIAALRARGCEGPRYLRLLRSRAVAAIPVALILLNMALPYVSFSYPVGQTLLNVLIAVALHRVMLVPDSVAGRILNSGPVASIGALSYSLYLWQQPFLNRRSDLLIAAFPVNIALAIVAAMLSYRLVEQPALRVRQRMEGNTARHARQRPDAPEWHVAPVETVHRRALL
jgi:peptidoglycan/LPS O-acetylase OafA/YrhL